MKFSLIIFLLICPMLMPAQVRDFKELTTQQIRLMDLAKTIVIIPGGLMEEHGPYLPLFTDGYTNEALAGRIADSIYRSTKYNVLIFPTIPIGIGSPETFGGMKSFPGVVYFKPSTLRTVFMDIGDMLGAQGVKWIFVVFKHGASLHNRSLSEACEYFNDTYEGKMVVLTALQYDTWKGENPTLSPAEVAENGIDIHAGMDETSRMLYNKPGLVDPGFRNADAVTVSSWEKFPSVTQAKDWKGYYGSPRLATREFGEMIMKKFSHNLSELAIRIINGYDYSKLPRLGEHRPNIAESKAEETIRAVAKEFSDRQRTWLNKKGITD